MLWHREKKMDSFEETVERCRKHRVREMLDNESVGHASVLARNLLQSAVDDNLDVKIVSGCLDKVVYGDLADLVQRIKKSGHVIEAVLTDQKADLQGNAFVEAIGMENISFSKEVFPHFIIAGDSAYRLEVNHSATKAKANFNDPNLGKRLLSLFETIKMQSTPRDE